MRMLRVWRPTPHILALLSFFAFYFILLQDIRHWAYRDPSSVFFDPQRAFERRYSLTREAQAETWIQAASDSRNTDYVKASADPSFCVGIATVQREGARYFRRTVGSTLAGLTEKERRNLYLVSFIANLDPSVHEAYNESWVSLVSDEVLTYNDAPPEVLAQVQRLVQNDLQFDRKPLYDYVHLLKDCYNKGLPYLVILEDDVIAAEGWYYRTKAALKALERQKGNDKMLYLRLFYNERIRGWNSEEWFSYTARIILLEAFVFGGLLAAVNYFPQASVVLTPLAILALCFLVTPMLIWMYFAAGRLTVSPLPVGLNRMDTYGCCSQAFVFPREQIPPLIEFYQEVGSGKIDVLTEYYANQKGLSRWALTPSVFAHVGSTSSKSSFISRWGRSNTENIWNFSFEMFDQEKLKDEHL